VIVDNNWQPGCSISALQFRAGLLRNTRSFFESRSVLEVNTPVLSRNTVSDPNIESFHTEADGEFLYLQTSPEFFMKRLLAAGAPGIYQIGPVFRKSEVGRLHNHEFTMLEWYRPDFDMETLMQEVAALVDLLLGPDDYSYLSIEKIFEQYFSVNPHTASRSELVDAYVAYRKDQNEDQIDFLGRLDRAAVFDLMFSLAQSRLSGRVFVVDFPVQHAALAKIETNNAGIDIARRFELIVNSIEVANGYLELLDSQECGRRMQLEVAQRLANNMPAPEPDLRLLAAMQYGLPDCSGVAMGLDRIVMLAMKVDSLAEVLPFTFENC
jgi:lysyl-tRNA synthetase class 2